MRKTIRRSWRCDCDGVSNVEPGRAKQGQVEMFSRIIKKDTGSIPLSCPWSVSSKPLVQDVISVRSMRRAKMSPGPISQRLMDGVAAFQAAYEGAAESRRELEKSQRAK